MRKTIDIVSFNVPYPADYGGVIDVYYRIKALKELGYSITLHCFQYGREKAVELEELCETVYYYSRKMQFHLQLRPTPFIVVSRSVTLLLENISKGSGAILFEGLHSTWFLSHPILAKRLKLVRTHNIEHEYYKQLAEVEPDWLKKVYFRFESAKLKRFEKQLVHADAILAISKNDTSHFQKITQPVVFIPPFHRENRVGIVPGQGDYVLYHGNLEVQENHEAALFILNEIAPFTQTKIVIAGHSPQKTLVERIKLLPNAELKADLSDEELSLLVAHAQIHLLPTFQATGFKLKLLYALFKGRFCLATPMMVEGTGLETLCSVRNIASEIVSEIDRIMMLEFTPMMIEKRIELLENEYSNRANAEKIDEVITTLQHRNRRSTS
jgi:hypothetical protein